MSRDLVKDASTHTAAPARVAQNKRVAHVSNIDLISGYRFSYCRDCVTREGATHVVRPLTLKIGQVSKRNRHRRAAEPQTNSGATIRRRSTIACSLTDERRLDWDSSHFRWMPAS
jgi:hypothetical protein